ncbi:VOC family protein [Fulvimonas yonginensis]|uniref:VOC family protein n=1 Tax=Fulvimonas yonginensis TaxID=1495200 RepID=A0ABU8JE93_9GAMM
MSLLPYVYFNGRCEEALNFYAACLGGGVRLLELHRFAGSPMAQNAPEGWGEKVMHASLGTEGQPLLLASDGMTHAPSEPPRGFSLAYGAATVEEAERVFAALAEGGRIDMPIAQTFFAARFGMLTDRYGIAWMVNCDG